jgi:AAA15 family ATPase/GTPase
MLIEFKVENFRSIREEQTLSFVGSNYDNELPDNYLTPELPGMSGVRVMKVAAIYGANASGKSNVISAIQFFAKYVANSFTDLKPEAPTGTVPFRFEKEWAERPTLFEITIFIDDIRYTYGLGLSEERVTEEYLIAFPNGKAQQWFERTWNPSVNLYDWTSSAENFQYDDALRKATRDNCTFLSVGAQFNHPKLSSVREWFTGHFKPDRSDFELRTSYMTAYCCHKLPSLHSSVLDFLKKADLGIVDFTVEKYPDDVTPDRKHYRLAELHYKIMLRHKGRDSDTWLSLSDESGGTQHLFSLAVPWIISLACGDFICIDEIETSLHPFLARELIKLFLNPEVNPNGAQLLFTTHNPILLDQELLRRDQFWFTEKDDSGATCLYPLTNYSPRKSEALMKGYLAGRYGGIPFIPERLIQQ